MTTILALLAVLPLAPDTLSPEAIPPAELIIDGRLPNGASEEAAIWHLGPPDSTAVIYNEIRGDTGYVLHWAELSLVDYGGDGSYELDVLRLDGIMPGTEHHFCTFAGRVFDAETTLDALRRVFPQSVSQGYQIEAQPWRFGDSTAVTVVPVSLSRKTYTADGYYFYFVERRLRELSYFEYP